MTHKFGNTIVVALGGSIVYPDTINVSFLKKFRKFVLQHIKKGKKFIIVQGGGQLCRLFQGAAHEVSPLMNDDKDWLGIHVTRLNGHLLRTIFRDVADPVMMDARGKIKKLKYPVTIAAGWRPGWSTDFVAAAVACDLHVPDYIVAGKPDHVYDRDPHGKGGEKAKPFDGMSWRKYRKLVPPKWVPGSHAPVDPIAAKLSSERKLKAIILDGRDLKNLENLLDGKAFEGTVIS